jgi:hypothetical protein
MVISVAEGGTEIAPPPIFRLSKPIDMIIHWKALKEHFNIGQKIYILEPVLLCVDKVVYFCFRKISDVLEIPVTSFIPA